MKLLDRRTLPFAILALGLLAAAILIATRPRVAPNPPAARVPLVRVQSVAVEDLRLSVHTHGEVKPRTESNLVPEVSGVVLWVSPNLVSGGFFEADEPLLRIDPLDYEVALETARATLARAESDVARAERELGRQRSLAEQDVTSVSRLDDAETNERAVRAALRQAKAALVQAERNLERTEIRAPYAGRVRDEQVDVGQFVNRGSSLARIYAVDFAEVRLPIPDEELAHLELVLVPGSNGDGPPVTLSAQFAGQRREWQGRVVRTEGELDPKSRMVHVVARVDDPYRPADADSPPLSVGLFVEAVSHGREVEGAVRVPRAALREGGRVWVADAEDQLRIRSVEIAQHGRDEVIVRSGLADGERVILSSLIAPVDGMPVRPFVPEAETTAAPEAEAAAVPGEGGS
ncbi:MAG: efflux RND transporter periplasmic adaptor subunit [Myxococcota bacterium]